MAALAAGYLDDSGWLRSVVERRPVDASGRPVPWMTLPFIQFIETRLRPTQRVFEFGSGNSTLYYAARVAQVVAVEHDPVWAARMKDSLPANARLLSLPLDRDGAYCRAAGLEGMTYDLIIVDGRDRANCAVRALSSLDPRGCIVWDDTERDDYREGLVCLREQGFRRIDFWGVAPGLSYKKCTSLLYRDGNCLGV